MPDFATLQPGYSGWGGVLFLIAQVSTATSAFALPLLALCCIVGSARGAFDFSLRPTRTEAGLGLFVAASLLTTFFGIDPSRSLSLSMPLWSVVLLVVAIGRERAARHALASMLCAIAVMSIVWSVDLLATLLHGEAGTSPLVAVERGMGSWLVVPNDFCFFVLLWPLWVRLASESRLRPAATTAVAVIIALHLAVIWQLQSRLGVALGMASLLLLRPRWPASRALAGAALVAGLLLAIWAVSAKPLDSIVVRLELWRAAAAIFADHPWTGVGPHNFVLAYPSYFSLDALALDPRLAPWPHSLPLELAAETGLAGCCAFLALLVCAAPRGRASAMSLVPMGTGALFVVLCLIEASTLRAWWWCLLAMTLAASNRYWIGSHATKICVAPAGRADRVFGAGGGSRLVRGDRSELGGEAQARRLLRRPAADAGGSR
jgi:O-antigen ligase